MTKKVLISIVLLLTYSLGFAHNFIPHSHVTESKEHVTAHEKDGNNHHDHSIKHLNSDHEHVSHGDHYDEGFYDLFVCFIHDTHNHQNDCKDQHYIPAKTNRVIATKLQANKLVTVLFLIILEPEQSVLFTDTQLNSKKTYLSPSIGDSPLRGPPSLKC